MHTAAATLAAHGAFVRILAAVELDTTITDCTEEECDSMFNDIKPIINKPYDPESKWTLLHLAAAHGNVDFCKKLILHGAKANSLDANRMTPLFHTPDSATQVKDLLVSHGAISDPDYFKTGEPQFASGSGFMNANFFRRILTMFVLPFGVLLFYNGPMFALKFLIGSALFYFISAGYFVAELVARPVWYNYEPGAKQLTLHNLPEDWRGTFHDPKFHFGIEYEDIKFESKGSDDGDYVLSGWYVPGKKHADQDQQQEQKQEQEGTSSSSSSSKKKIPQREMGLVFTHGGGRDRRAWLRHLPFFHEAGYTCLLYDMREHGISSGTGKGLGYGIKERFDVRAAAQYMRRQRGWKRIAAIGTSVGAAATISGAALAPNDIDVIIAENPMLTCSQLQSVLLSRVVGPLFRGTRISRPIFTLFKKISSMFLNWRLGNVPSKKCQSMHTIGSLSPRPVLLMHGTFDEVVPAAHGQKLFDLANEPKEFWLLPEGHHCNLYDLAPEEYQKRVLGFLHKYEKGTDFTVPLNLSSASLVSLGSSRNTSRAASARNSPRNDDNNDKNQNNNVASFNNYNNNNNNQNNKNNNNKSVSPKNKNVSSASSSAAAASSGKNDNQKKKNSDNKQQQNKNDNSGSNKPKNSGGANSDNNANNNNKTSNKKKNKSKKA